MLQPFTHSFVLLLPSLTFHTQPIPPFAKKIHIHLRWKQTNMFTARSPQPLLRTKRHLLHPHLLRLHRKQQLGDRQLRLANEARPAQRHLQQPKRLLPLRPQRRPPRHLQLPNQRRPRQ